MEFGGVCDGGCFNTPFNTIGIGDPVPAGIGNMLGSGDKFTGNSNKKNKKEKIASKKSAPNYGEQLPLVVYSKNK